MITISNTEICECYCEGQAIGSNPDKGFNFGAIHRALDFAETTSPNDVEIALVFDSTRHISSVPVKAVQAELARAR
jgi:hypothetical protein